MGIRPVQGGGLCSETRGRVAEPGNLPTRGSSLDSGPGVTTFVRRKYQPITASTGNSSKRSSIYFRAARYFRLGGSLFCESLLLSESKPVTESESYFGHFWRKPITGFPGTLDFFNCWLYDLPGES